MFGTQEGFKAQSLKDEDREYDLALAPLKRILQKGSKDETGQVMRGNHKMSEAALLFFRKQVEDYALSLAKETGKITRSNGRPTIKWADILIAKDTLSRR